VNLGLYRSLPHSNLPSDALTSRARQIACRRTGTRDVRSLTSASVRVRAVLGNEDYYSGPCCCPAVQLSSWLIINSATSRKSIPTMSGCSPTGSRTIFGRATNAAAQPARTAPVTSQACGLDSQTLGSHEVHLAGRLQPFDHVCRERMLEELAQASVLELGLRDFSCRVCQRRHAEACLAQAPQAFDHIRMWRKLADRPEDVLLLIWRQIDSVTLCRHLQRGAAQLRKVAVAL
jgi:hypothetical protein